MHTENLIVYESCDWQTVEAISKGLPQLDIVPTTTLIVEAVDAVDACTFVIAS